MEAFHGYAGRAKGFEGRQVMVRPGTFFHRAFLMIDGAKPLREPEKNFLRLYLLRDNFGKEVVADLQTRIFDPIPKVVIGDRVVELARPLFWHEYAWMSIPIIMIVAGGALGALFGAATVHFNSKIFRSDRRTFIKYLLTGLVSAIATFMFVILVVALQRMIHPQR
jgi:hypothetical protein